MGRINRQRTESGGLKPAGTVEELCNNMVRLFSECNPMEIAEEDYTAVMSFLLERNLFSFVEGVSSRVSTIQRPDLERAKASLVCDRAEKMLMFGDLPSLKSMLSNPLISYSVISSDRDLVPAVCDYVRPRCADPGDVSALTDRLRNVMPSDPYYSGLLDTVCSRVSSEKAPAEPVLQTTIPTAVPVSEPPGSGMSAEVPAAESGGEPADAPVPEGRSVTVRVNRMDVTLYGDPFAYGWKYKLYRARIAGDGRDYAFRMLVGDDPYDPKVGGLPEGLPSLMSEQYLWFQLTDRYPDMFVNLLETCDYPFRGQLAEMASRSLGSAGPMSREDKAKAAVSLLRALQCMHDEGYVHNDVKPENILEVGGRWKLFGFDAAFRSGSPAANINGIPEYMSPEQLSDGEITCRSDVWGAAVVIHQMFTGMLPFEGRGEMYRRNAVSCSFRPGILDPALVPLLSGVFVEDPDRRPTAAELADSISAIF